MPKKAIVQKKKKEKEAEEVKKPPVAKYFYAVGRRKTSVARAKLFNVKNPKDAVVLVNKKTPKDYFSVLSLQNTCLVPLKLAGGTDSFKVLISVKGGGFRGQAEAARLAVSRALVLFDKNLKKALKSSGFLTRDPRIVERKKAGLKKARRAPQWQKR